MDLSSLMAVALYPQEQVKEEVSRGLGIFTSSPSSPHPQDHVWDWDILFTEVASSIQAEADREDHTDMTADMLSNKVAALQVSH